jgi:hypothetical protein
LPLSFFCLEAALELVTFFVAMSGTSIIFVGATLSHGVFRDEPLR